jgi:hypothetical protein
MTSEKRRHPRQATNHIAHVKFPIKLLDISQSGARISVDQSIKLPGEFVLLISADLARWCRIKWRRGEQVGVEFYGPGGALPKALRL